MREMKEWRRRNRKPLPPEILRNILGKIYTEDVAEELYGKLIKGDTDEEDTEG